MNEYCFHPNTIFCDSDKWNKDEIFRLSYLNNLDKYLNMIDKFDIEIDMTDEFLSIFWKYAPWKNQKLYFQLGMNKIYNVINSKKKIFNPPPNCVCNIDQKIDLDFSCEEVDIEKIWLILIHRMIHKNEDGKIICDEGGENFDISCECREKIEVIFDRIGNVLDLYKNLNFLDYWPSDENEFDEKILKVLDIFYYQNFYEIGYKIQIESIKFDDNFVSKLLNINDETEKKIIIKNLCRRTCLNIGEAGQDTSLQEERLHDNIFRFRVSKGGRIHHELNDESMLVLNYYAPEEHP